MKKYTSLTNAERHDAVCKAYDLVIGFKNIIKPAGLSSLTPFNFNNDEEKNTVSFEAYYGDYKWLSLGCSASIWDTDEVMRQYNKAVAAVCAWLVAQLDEARAALAAPEVEEPVDSAKNAE